LTNKMFFTRCLLCFILILSITAASAVPVGAATKSELEAKQSQIKKKQSNIKNQLSSVRKDEAKAQEALDLINELIEANKEEINNINSYIVELNNEIAENQALIAEKDAEINENYERFKKRIRALYMAGDVTGGFELILCADSFEEMLNATAYAKALAKYDQSLIDALKSDRDGYSSKIDAIEEDKAEAEKKKAEISAIKEENDKLAEEAKQKLKEVRAQEAKLEALQAQYEKEMESASAQIAALVKGSGSANTSNGKVSFIWPTPSCYRVSSYYGMRTLMGVKRMHKGIDIPAAGGAKILAAAGGTVVTSSYDSGGYGNYVIINHGNGYCTVYGHMRSRAVSRGATVKQGQVIGYVGTTGRSTGNHLHFEIRNTKTGGTENPMNWF